MSETNSIIYTTHSPFLIDADKLERARKVYINENGETEASSDLRKHPTGGTDEGAAYAVHSALNMSVAESFLIGCKPIIVEGPSDQRYLSGIKSLLISEGLITPKRELVFMPGGGSRTTRAVASMVSGREEDLPLVLLDSDEQGGQLANGLKSSLYNAEKEKVRQVHDFTNVEKHEIEDLIPFDFMCSVVDRWQRRANVLFVDVAKEGEPIVDQISNWAKSQSISLELGWKVELANVAKQQMLKLGSTKFDKDTKAIWTKVFKWFVEK